MTSNKQPQKNASHQGPEPPEHRPRTWGRRPSVADPSHPALLPTFEPSRFFRWSVSLMRACEAETDRQRTASGGLEVVGASPGLDVIDPLLDRRMLAGFWDSGNPGGPGVQVDVSTGRQQRLLACSAPCGDSARRSRIARRRARRRGIGVEGKELSAGLP